MLEIGGELDLLEESLGPDDCRQFRMDDLDCDLAAMAEVFGEVDGGHAALSELALDAVAVGEGGGEGSEGVGQALARGDGTVDDTVGHPARQPPRETSIMDPQDFLRRRQACRLLINRHERQCSMQPENFSARPRTRIRRTLLAMLGAVVLVPGGRGFAAQEPMTPLPAPTIPSSVPVAASTAPVQAAAQDTGAKIPAAQLDALVAPIALYPDPLLAQTLVASTYPLEIIQLQQWMAKHPGLKDKALADSVAKQPWDPSIQSMAAVPEVVKRLADDIQWTTELGNAFLAQQADVMDAVQADAQEGEGQGRPRPRTSSRRSRRRSSRSKTVIVVQPTNPEVIYVPTYSPTVVYGPPVYPYPPIYYPPLSAGRGDGRRSRSA